MTLQSRADRELTTLDAFRRLLVGNRVNDRKSEKIKDPRPKYKFR